MRSLLSSVLLFLFVLAPSWAAAAERPNVLFVLTDDQAPWALGASGNPQAKTPQMDRLFGEGAYLVNCFTTTPVCSPSRASLMTSRYGSELNITDWINPRVEKELGLDPATVTWPEVIQAGGYTTGLVGKWHLGLPDRFHPTKTGFDRFMGFRGGGYRLTDPDLEIASEESNRGRKPRSPIRYQRPARQDRGQDARGRRSGLGEVGVRNNRGRTGPGQVRAIRIAAVDRAERETSLVRLPGVDRFRSPR